MQFKERDLIVLTPKGIKAVKEQASDVLTLIVHTEPDEYLKNEFEIAFAYPKSKKCIIYIHGSMFPLFNGEFDLV